MAGHKETPRQKMISVMYLVLTAMLALNVSKEVLEGYVVVNDSLQITNESFMRKRKGTYAELERDFKLNQEEIGPFWNKARQAMKLSDEMVEYIKNLRDELIAATEGIPLDSAKTRPFRSLKKKDDYTTPTNFMIGPVDNGSQGKARKLKEKIIAYRESMKKLVNPRFKNQIKIGLETEGDYRDASGQKLNWEMHYFYDIPLGADIPIFNKFIAEINNAELEVVNGLLYEINADDFKYDKIEAKILPKSTYLFPGEKYEAEVIVAAYDTSHIPIPNVYLMRGVDSLPVSMRANATIVPREKGKMHFEFPTTGIGIQKYAGFVSMYNNSGREHIYHFNSEFLVGQPSLAISPTNMNVLYIGVNNPISISVTGVPAENIVPTISAGMLRLNPDRKGWTATVPAGAKQATISVSVRTEGSLKPMGSENFRVKTVPDPTPRIGGKKEGFITRSKLVEAGKISISMPSDFEFDYAFEVVSFKMSMTKGFTDYQFESKSAELTNEMIQEIRKTNRGQMIFFEDIVVKAPEGSNRTISPIMITISQ
jgi:gliding motility-associated protein GldM